jgi:hypothetical protein
MNRLTAQLSIFGMQKYESFVGKNIKIEGATINLSAAQFSFF